MWLQKKTLSQSGDFHSFNRILQRTKIPNSDEVHFNNFFLLKIVLSVLYFRNLCLTWVHKDFLLEVFQFRFHIRFIIHFEFIFYVWIKVQFFAYGYSIFPISFVEKAILHHFSLLPFHLCWKLIDHVFVAYIWTLYSLPLIYLSIIMSYCLDCYFPCQLYHRLLTSLWT